MLDVNLRKPPASSPLVAIEATITITSPERRNHLAATASKLTSCNSLRAKIVPRRASISSQATSVNDFDSCQTGDIAARTVCRGSMGTAATLAAGLG